MASKLALQPYEGTDCNILRIFDASEYSPGINVTCGQLLVTPPGFTYPAGFDVEPGFNIVLNSKNLGLVSQKAKQTPPVPDGVYILKYSINPNDKVWVEYTYLRNCQQLSRYYEALCKVDLEPCDNRIPEVEDAIKKLSIAKIYIDAAKALVELCNSPKKGAEIYDYANKLLGDVEKCVGKCKTCK